MKRGLPLTLCCASLLGFGALSGWSQRMPWQAAQEGNQPPQSVAFLYPEQVTIPADKPADVELHFRVANGLHINSHNPRDKYLIRTELIVAEPQGVHFSAVDFPPGTDFALASAPQNRLSVYTGEFALKAHLKATPGDHLVQAWLRYQACDTNSCFPPRKAPVTVDLIAK